MRTNFPKENGESVLSDTNLTQETPQIEPGPVKYPKLLKRRGVVLARIYKPSKAYPLYRLAWTVGGKRQIKGFASYSAAIRHGMDHTRKHFAIDRVSPQTLLADREQ